jgi:hypothetical protein
MTYLSDKEYLLSLPDMTEDDYKHWQMLMRSMTTSARMMGLKDCPMTQQVFRTALDNLMNFEKEHHIQFYELGVSLANAQASV